MRYLAACLGPEGIRVNGISAGPIKTLAAAGIGGFSKILRFVEKNAPLRRNVTIDEVGNVAAFLLSDLASGDHRRDHVRRLRLLDRRRRPRRRLNAARVRAPRSRSCRMIAAARASTPSSSAAATTASSAPRISRRAGLVGVRARAPRRRSAAPRSPRNSIPAFAIRPRATRSACSIRKVIRDLRLARARARDRRAAAREFPAAAGRRRISRSAAASRRRRRRSRSSRARDAERLPAYYAMLDRVADVLRELLLATPPNVGGGVQRAARRVEGRRKRFRALDLAGQRDVLDLFTKSAGEVLDRWFESAPIKAAFGFDAVVGNFASPYTPGSAYVLLHHVFGEVNGKRGQWGHALGGMGAITQAMARECAARGVDAPHRRRRRARDRRGRPRRGRRARRAARSSRARASSPTSIRSCCSSSWSRPSTCRRRFPRAHRRLSLRLGHVPHERRAVRVAGFHRAARDERAAASRQRHHHRAVARLHGARVLRRAHARLVARADRRDADSLGRRRLARAAGHARREPVLPARASGSRATCARDARGTTRATRSPT